MTFGASSPVMIIVISSLSSVIFAEIFMFIFEMIPFKNSVTISSALSATETLTSAFSNNPPVDKTSILAFSFLTFNSFNANSVASSTVEACFVISFIINIYLNGL